MSLRDRDDYSEGAKGTWTLLGISSCLLLPLLPKSGSGSVIKVVAPWGLMSQRKVEWATTCWPPPVPSIFAPGVGNL